MKLCVTTVFPVLWFVGSSTGMNMSMLYVSLVKFPLLLLVNAKLFLNGGRRCVFSRVFYMVRNFQTKLLAQQVLIQQSLGKAFWAIHPEGCCLHLTSPRWSQCRCAQGKGTGISAPWRCSTPCVPAWKSSKKQGAFV